LKTCTSPPETSRIFPDLVSTIGSLSANAQRVLSTNTPAAAEECNAREELPAIEPGGYGVRAPDFRSLRFPLKISVNHSVLPLWIMEQRMADPLVAQRRLLLAAGVGLLLAGGRSALAVEKRAAHGK